MRRTSDEESAVAFACHSLQPLYRLRGTGVFRRGAARAARAHFAVGAAFTPGFCAPAYPAEPPAFALGVILSVAPFAESKCVVWTPVPFTGGSRLDAFRVPHPSPPFAKGGPAAALPDASGP